MDYHPKAHMCGRFTLDHDTVSLIAAFGFYLPDIQIAPRFNIAPSQPVLSIVHEAGQRVAKHFHWGFIPHWAKTPDTQRPLINARSETAHEKPTFRDSFRYKRCIIPATGFYEWQKTPGGKRPIYIQPRDGKPMPMAGLWSHWQNTEGSEFETVCILTTTANLTMKPIHHRMPVILKERDFQTWLDPHLQTIAPLMPLLIQAPDNYLTTHRVSSRINAPGDDDATLIHPIESEPGEQMGLFGE